MVGPGKIRTSGAEWVLPLTEGDTAGRRPTHIGDRYYEHYHAPDAGGAYKGALFGSDFNYADFRARSASDYRIEVLGRDRIDGGSCRVLRLRPLDGPYTMLLAWVSEERPVMLRTDYFDEQGLWKRYTAHRENIAQNLEWWVPMQDEMVDLRTGRHTVRQVRNLLIGTEVPDDAFTLIQLARGRLPSF